MDKVAIVTDSVACLPKEVAEEYGIRVVPAANIFIDGKTYREWVDITPSQAYELLEKSPGRFSTSAISPDVFVEVFSEICRQGHSILCITLSSELSAVYNMARVAKEQTEARFPEARIEVLDSLTASASEGLIVLEAGRSAAKGDGMDEVLRRVEQVRNSVKVVGLLETVRYVYRTGRVPRVAAWLGSALHIKPIFTLSKGKVHSIGIVRNKQRGMDRLVKIMREDVGTARVHVAVMHAAELDEAHALKEVVAKSFNCAEILMMEFSPVMAYSTGQGVVGLAYYSDEGR